MNTLYYVVLRNHAKNQRTHFLVTAADGDAAEQIVLNTFGIGWRAEPAIGICATPDHVVMEV